MWAFFLRLKTQIRLLNRKRLRKRQARRGPGYAEWVAQYDTVGVSQRAALQARLLHLNQHPRRPLIAVLMPVYDPPPSWLLQAIASVRAQLYPHWELCIADDASSNPEVRKILADAAAADPRIRVHWRTTNGHICRASNDALSLVTAPFVALLDHDDVLAEHALLLVAEVLIQNPQACLLYSDEDKLALDGARCSPYFKPDWNPELLLSQNYLCHLVVYHTAQLRELGGFTPGFEGAQDHDLALRFTQGLRAEQVVHIPHVLYHWRQHDASTASSGKAKPYALHAGQRAVQAHLERLGLQAAVECDHFGFYGVRPQAPPSEPLVSIIIPTRDGLSTLPRCVASLKERTLYRHWELIVVDNGSAHPDFLHYLHVLSQDPRCHVMRDDRPFNYSALNNEAVKVARGEVLALLNDDTEIITPDWLCQMTAWALQPGVGAVGARLWYSDMTLQHAGVVLGIGDVAGHSHRHLSRSEPGYHGRACVLQNFSAVTAACLVVRKALYEQVGGLDAAQLAVAFNDVDFCLKLRKAGYRNVLAALAELMHHESASRGSDREPRHRARYEAEAAVMRDRWANELLQDPAYNTNFSLENEHFFLAFPPRVSPWQLCTKASP
jgi:O-antigen biosynthesis protein